jgi:hypothetical protein
VKKAAALRLAALVEPAIATLAYAMKRRSKALPQAITAANSVLDRTGHGTKQTIQIEDGERRVAQLKAGRERARVGRDS